MCVCVCTCVCLCVGTCDGMGPSQHNCHFAPPLQVLHTGEAGSSDGRLLPGIYGKWQLPLNKAGVAGGKGGKTTEVPKTNERTHTHTADASLEFISSALPGNLVVNVLFILFFFFFGGLQSERVKERPALNLLPLFGVMVYEIFFFLPEQNHISYMAASWWIISHFTYLPF